MQLIAINLSFKTIPLWFTVFVKVIIILVILIIHMGQYLPSTDYFAPTSRLNQPVAVFYQGLYLIMVELMLLK